MAIPGFTAQAALVPQAEIPGEIRLPQAPWRRPSGGCPQRCSRCSAFDYWYVVGEGWWQECVTRDCDLYYRLCAPYPSGNCRDPYLCPVNYQPGVCEICYG